MQQPNCILRKNIYFLINSYDLLQKKEIVTFVAVTQLSQTAYDERQEDNAQTHSQTQKTKEFRLNA